MSIFLVWALWYLDPSHRGHACHAKKLDFLFQIIQKDMVSTAIFWNSQKILRSNIPKKFPNFVSLVLKWLTCPIAEYISYKMPNHSRYLQKVAGIHFDQLYISFFVKLILYYMRGLPPSKVSGHTTLQNPVSTPFLKFSWYLREPYSTTHT